MFVIPEDDANRELAQGFVLGIHWSRQRQIRVCPVAKGGKKVLLRFKMDHVPKMATYPSRLIVLLLDCDGDAETLTRVRGDIPKPLSERVFVLGVLKEPEDLKAALGPYESIGLALAKDCQDNTFSTWGHQLLQHNVSELDRLRERVRPILF